MRAWLNLAVMAWVAGLPAQAPATAASVTEPGRALLRPLEMWLAGAGAEGERTLLLLLDPSPSLAAAGFADVFDSALAGNRTALQQTRLGLGVVGQKGVVVVPPGKEHDRVASEVGVRLQKPGADFADLDADLRTVAAALGNAPGKRSVLLVTLDNGDVESDLEATAQALVRARVELTVLTTEACVADSYWASRPYQDKPRGTTLQGGDAPVIDLPYGWLFQVTVANEVTPAGFGPYALTRLAAATGGRVHLYTAPSQTAHSCAIYGTCLFCNGDHLPSDETFWDARLAQLAPLSGSRQDAMTELGRDPYFRLVVQTWREAAQEGLLSSTPPVRLSGTSAAPDRQRGGRDLGLFASAGVARQEKRAEKAADAAAKLGQQLQRDLDQLGLAPTLRREEACARFSLVMLQLARVNLLIYAAWCRDVAPRWLDEKLVPLAPEVLEPEVLEIDGPDRPVGIGYTNMSLCHGVRPYYEIELPGGARLRPELEKLDALMTAFVQRYGHTPYAFALRRMGIARFHFVYPGIAGRIPRQRPKSALDDKPVTTPRRPPRNGAGSSGGSGGPTTGGK